MLTLNSNILKIGNKWVIPHSGSGPTPTPTVYQVTTSGTHGTVTASPTEGTTGTEITLSNTPDTHYHFGSYSLTGATLKNANQFDIADSDVSVVGNFIEDTKYSVTVNQSTGGTISASPVQGYTGTEVTLSNTPATHYSFGSYNLTGATLKSANKFDIGTSNVTVGATWIEDTKYSVTCTNDGHGTIAASPTSNYSGSTVTLSNTPNSGYNFDKYTIVSGTGASISGNTLTIGTSNVTVRGDFVVASQYSAYRISITRTYSTSNSSDNYGFPMRETTALPALNIKNVSRTCTEGAAQYYDSSLKSYVFTSTDLGAMTTSSGVTTPELLQGIGFLTASGSYPTFTLSMPNPPTSGYSADLLITLEGKDSNNNWIQVGTTTVTLSSTPVNVSFTEANPYLYYAFHIGFWGNSTLGVPSQHINNLSFSPIGGKAYEYVNSSWSWNVMPITWINEFTSTSTSTYATTGQTSYDPSISKPQYNFRTGNKLDSVSIKLLSAEYGTVPAALRYYDCETGIVGFKTYCNTTTGAPATITTTLATNTQQITSWPTTVSIRV